MLKLGIIGLSEGNGHPYSWAAIFNGYNYLEIKHCGFPIIADYLSKEIFPACTIKNAEVTHIWTQDLLLSQKVAKASNIKNICKAVDELISSVDAILLARDDWQSHVELGPLMLASGKPVFIDKPIAIDLSTLNYLYGLEKTEGQIFTCSAMRYANELILSENDRLELGEIKYVFAKIPKSWEKYAVHIIEPVISIINSNIQTITSTKLSSFTSTDVKWESGAISSFLTTGDSKHTLTIEIIGTKTSKVLELKNTFAAFKSALEIFVDNCINDTFTSEYQRQKQIIMIIEEGMKNQ
jgi:predicted dehydrogenase